MFFNSIDFAIFLPVVFLLYWFVFQKDLKKQNLFILFASYFFYGCWDWRFLFLIAFSTVVDFMVAKKVAKSSTKKAKKRFLAISLIVNIGLLIYFKYANFFIESFVDSFRLLGNSIEISTLYIILPVGISFYTFQTLSYTIDVYRGKLSTANNFINFAAFVSFFPQLVAGPIERATNLLPQFYKQRVFSYENASNGLRQILWGLFKKIVIADSCARYVNIIFADYASLNSTTLILGAIFFSFQIYGDFSGYSDIAIGTSKLLGFDLMKNFNYPYFSRNIGEFWRRWHISLSTWFRDYLYIPLGGSRVSKQKQIRNTFIIFLVSGFWHGANWTFIAWGLLNALYFLPLLLSNSNRKYIDDAPLFPKISIILRIVTTNILVIIAWIFFRADSITIAFDYIKDIVLLKGDILPVYRPKDLFIKIILFVIVEWLFRRKDFPLQHIHLKVNTFLRWSIYIGLIWLIALSSGQTENIEFIYFQF